MELQLKPNSIKTGLYNCFIEHTEKSLKLGIYGSLLLLAAHLAGYDKIISIKISSFSSIDENVSYWLFYLVITSTFLVINLYYLYIAFKAYTFSPDDWKAIKIELKKKRLVYDFGTKQKELITIPKYIYFFFAFLFLFGVIDSFDYMIISPITALLHTSNHEIIFSFHKREYTTLFLFIIMPPQILILLAIGIVNLLKIRFTLSRR